MCRHLVLNRAEVHGIVLCPIRGCPCGSTFRAATSPSTPEEIDRTRQRVRSILTGAGLPLPAFLQ